MKTSILSCFRARRPSRAVCQHLLSSAAAVVLLSGCAADYVDIDRTLPPYFHAQNVFIHTEGLDAMPRRILVLPCWGDAPAKTLRDIDEVLWQEFGKANVAELVVPPRESTINRRSEQEFTLDEARKWAHKAGAEGVLTCRVTSCSPHRPIALGVALRIWSLPKDTTVWAVDETLDSQLTLVANGARNYYLTEFRAPYPARRSEAILESPRMFFQYVFAELFITLPGKAPGTVPERGLFPPPERAEGGKKR